MYILYLPTYLPFIMLTYILFIILFFFNNHAFPSWAINSVIYERTNKNVLRKPDILLSFGVCVSVMGINVTWGWRGRMGRHVTEGGEIGDHTIT